MKLIDALREIGSDSNKFTVNKINTEILGIRYRKKKDDMINCNRTTGEYVAGLPLLIWDYRMLDSDGWEIKTIVTPKYKIGDRFLFNTLGYDISKEDGTFLNQTYTNVIGKIADWHCNNLGEILYKVSLENTKSDLLLGEEYLEELDMVVSQE